MRRLREWWHETKESPRNGWRDIKSYLKYQSTCVEDDNCLVKELKEACDMAAKYELIQKHQPNILARLEASAERREKGGEL